MHTRLEPGGDVGHVELPLGDVGDERDDVTVVTTLNGWVLDLPAHRAEEIADDLRARGHTVERTDLDIA